MSEAIYERWENGEKMITILEDPTYITIDLDKIQTIEEVKAVLRLALMAGTNWDGEGDIRVSTNTVNYMPVLNNLIKDKADA